MISLVSANSYVLPIILVVVAFLFLVFQVYSLVRKIIDKKKEKKGDAVPDKDEAEPNVKNTDNP